MCKRRAGLLAVLTLLLPLLAPIQGWAAPTFFWTFEDATLSAFDGDPDYSAGDPTAATTNSPAIDAAAAFVGSSGLLIDGANESYRFNPASIASPSEGSFGFWIRWQNFTTTGSSFFLIVGANSNDFISVAGTSINELRVVVRNNVSGVVNTDTTAVDFVNGTTYFVTFSWDDPGDRRRLCVYNSSAVLLEPCTIVTSAFTGPADFNRADGLRIGEAQGLTTSFYQDNLFIGSSYDDADCFVTNRNITTYTAYAPCGGGGSGPPVGSLMLMGVGR